MENQLKCSSIAKALSSGIVSDSICAKDKNNALLENDPLQLALQGRYSESLKGIEDHNEESAATKYLLCRCLINIRRFDEALIAIHENTKLLESSDVKKLKARIYLSTNQMVDGIRLLEECIESDKKDWEAISLKAALGGSRWEELFTQSLSLFPNQADAIRNRAGLRFKSGRIEEGIKDLQDILNFRKNYTPAFELLHQLMMHKGDYKTLHGQYKSLPKDVWTTQIKGMYISLLIILNKNNEAWEYAKKELETDINNDEFTLCAAGAAKSLNKVSEAKRLYKEVISKNSNMLAARAKNNLAIIAVDENDLPQALTLIQEARDLAPLDIDIWLHKIELDLRNGDQEQAENSLEILSKKYKTCNYSQRIRVLFSQSRLLEQQHDINNAFVVAEKIRLLCPGKPESWINLSNILTKKHEHNKAIEVIKEGLAHVEQKEILQAEQLQIILKKGSADMALEKVKQWLEEDKKKENLLIEYSNILAILRKYKKAEEVLKELMEINEKEWSKVLIQFLLSRDRAKEALKLCESNIVHFPDTIVPYQLAARASMRLNEPDQAEDYLKSARKLDPDRIDILQDLIGLYQLEGRYEEAIETIEREAIRSPRLPLVNMALRIIERSKNWDRGYELTKILMRNKFSKSEAEKVQVRILRRMGKEEEALNLSRELAHNNPLNIRFKGDYVRELLIQEKYEKAIEESFALSKILPDKPQRLIVLTELLLSCECPEMALSVIRKQKNKWNNNAEIPWIEIRVLQKLGRIEDAAILIENIADESISSPQVLERSVITLLSIGEYKKALNILSTWKILQPDNSSILWLEYEIYSAEDEVEKCWNLLNILKEETPWDNRILRAETDLLVKEGKYISALEKIKQNIYHSPTDEGLKNQKLQTKISYGMFEDFDEDLEKLDDIRKEDKYLHHANYFFNTNCNPYWDAIKVHDFHNNWYQKAIEPKLPPIPNYNHIIFDEERTLRIGYISGDYRQHSVSYFSEPVMISHDHQRYEVYAYATHNPKSNDETTERFKSYFDHWIDAYMLSDLELYRRIRKDKIDILVDLSGHTNGGKLNVFARKPSPIQLTAVFGSGQTTGIKRIDYMICDKLSVPSEHSEYIAEKPVYLPFDGYPYMPSRDYIEPKPLPMLTGKAFTFGCITRAVRVNSEVCLVWGKILSKCPDARLVFEHKTFHEKEIQEHYIRLLQAAGAHPTQIEFKNTRPYWSLFHSIDLPLDPWPAGSGTVGTDAMWMERPPLTLTSRPIMGRWMLSQLAAVDLEKDFACKTVDEYISKAIDFATEQKSQILLQERTTGLRERMKNSRLMNYKEYGDDLARLYRKLWKNRCKEYAKKAI